MLPASKPGEDDESYTAFVAIRAFRSALHGFVSLEAGGGFGMPEAIDDSSTC